MSKCTCGTEINLQPIRQFGDLQRKEKISVSERLKNVWKQRRGIRLLLNKVKIKEQLCRIGCTLSCFYFIKKFSHLDISAAKS